MASDSAISTVRGKYNATKISVWWDMEECEVPKEFGIDVITENIKIALQKINYCGPVSFSAYVDTTRLPSLIRGALESTGISLCHVPAGLKDDRDKKMLVDMLSWAIDNPAPAYYLLICGKKDFSFALQQFSMRGYDILLAHPANLCDALFPSAKSVWNWTSLLSGDFPIASGESHPKRLLGQAQGAVRMNRNAFPIPILFTPNRNSDINEEECQPPSKYKSVSVALHYLKEEKMIPTKENIQDFIRYGDRGDRNFDVEEALNYELKHDMIESQNLGDLSLYLPRNGYLWECVNPEGGREDQYSKATWDFIESFLSSSDGRIEMTISECRFEACLKLRNLCLHNFRLGRIIS
ncbi:uncharacterized protein LOC141690881 [Apium graveolens]|uniref:uncharacterized protein LOC141690881 n=1 Tax=Apium graveolens TaxID=4045 RepID=UPI003D7A9E70